MAGEFVNFLIFYLILTMMFVMIGTLMFNYYSNDYSSLFNTFITVLNVSVGSSIIYTDFDVI